MTTELLPAFTHQRTPTQFCNKAWLAFPRLAEFADFKRKYLALYSANQALLTCLASAATWATPLKRELVTGIQQVKTDNVAREYAQKRPDNLREKHQK